MNKTFWVCLALSLSGVFGWLAVEILVKVAPWAFPLAVLSLYGCYQATMKYIELQKQDRRMQPIQVILGRNRVIRLDDEVN